MALLVPGERDQAARDRSDEDVFGVRMLHPSMPGGMEWVASWGRPRTFTGIDPEDPWFDAAHGSGSFVAGGGLLRISGSAPRMYVHDPALEQQWRDVEITVYVQRVADAGIPFAGLTAVARANHLRTEEGAGDQCDTRGYGARLRFDGHADFEKETAHPHNQAVGNTLVFPGEMPHRRWLGVKFVVLDHGGTVHLQLWLDRTDGRDGGHWVLLDQVTDDGHLFGAVACAPGIDPAMPLTADPDRPGSESGRPNLCVYFRSDGIAADGLLYKWASVREIRP